jgi:methyltransferase
MSSYLVLELVTVLLILQRVSELVLAKRNARRSFERGGIEVGAAHYPVIVVLHVLWFVAFNAEAIIRGDGPVQGAWGAWPIWLVLFVVAQVLRYAAISALGDAWNTRIIIVPGLRRVARGPYRFMPHPNYVAVIMEFISVPLLVNAPLTALGFTVANLFILLRVRIPAEREALAQMEKGHGTP